MKKIICIVLALSMLFALSACKKEQPKDDTVAKIMTLNGTTGFGMAKMMHDLSASENKAFEISVETDASNVTAALVNKSVDIAALPTNAASALYNKTQGGIQVIALNTKGVLYLIGTTEISSLDELTGKTVYAPAQNPSFIFNAICKSKGLDITADNSYAQPADLRTAVAAGKVDYAVLPEPMVTMAIAANSSVKVLADLTKEWDNAVAKGELVQGCVVVRKEFAEEHPQVVAEFLKEYEKSIAFLNGDPENAAKYIVEAEIFANEGVAKKAIPNCNVCYIAGKEMKTALNGFLEVLLEYYPQSIGGALPKDDFYFGL